MITYNALILGSESQIGKEILSISETFQNFKFFFKNKRQLDIRMNKLIENFVIKNKINLIINCAAFTNVDLAEKQKKKCLLINYNAIKNLARLCSKYKIFLIHFSSDYVFDGKNISFYTEKSKANPINFYGYSKYLGDKILLKIKPPGLIIRTSWVYSEYNNNFVKTILNQIKKNKLLNVVNDQFGSPTYANDIARILLKIISSKKFRKIAKKIKIYNISGDVKISWFRLAFQIAKYKKYTRKIYPISSSQFKTKTLRPKNSPLRCNKIVKVFSIKIPNWKKSLKQCIYNLNYK